MIRIVIIDDDALVVESLKIILGTFESIDVVGTGSDGADALRLRREVEFDVMLLDMRMKHIGGVDVLKAIGQSTTILVLSTFDEGSLVLEAFQHHAKGYVLKSEKPEAIYQAIVNLYEGRSIFSQESFRHLRQELTKPAEHSVGEKFTEREGEVIRLIGEGMTNRDIAQKLFISEGTVKNHITAILQKTGYAHRTQIAVGFLTGDLAILS